MDIKDTPQVYTGDTGKQPFNDWKKKMIAHCDGVNEGLRTMMEWAGKQEAETGPPELIGTE